MNTYNSRSKKNLNVTTIWNGTTWSSGTPSTYMIVRIQGTYSTLTSGSFSCLDMYLDSNKITIGANTRISVLRNITQTYSGTYSIILQDLGELALLDPNVDVSTVKLQIFKTFKNYNRLDYISTGTPIVGKTLQSLSTSTLSNRFGYLGGTGSNNINANNYTNAALITTEIGMGYIIRTPNTFPDRPAAPTNFTISVDNVTSGTFSTGIVVRNLKYDMSNLFLSNPYTARIDFRKFYQVNKDIIKPFYLVYEENSNSLLSVNETGYPYRYYSLYSSVLDNRPTYILPMQGFYCGFVSGLTQGSLTFTPDMMILGQDFDTPDRITFKMTSATNTTNGTQINWPISRWSYEFNHYPRIIYTPELGNYLVEPTTSVNTQKAQFLYTGNTQSTSMLMEDTLRNDIWLRVTKVGYSTYSTTATASIEINTTSGYFATASVYIYDYEAGVSQDLKAGAYTFVATYSVTYIDRFKISFS
jgi:hypothetical protein